MLLLIAFMHCNNLNLFSIITSVFLVLLSPCLFKLIKEQLKKKHNSKQIEADKERPSLISVLKTLYINKGFSLSDFVSESVGTCFLCTRKGTRDGKHFCEKGLLLVILTENEFDIADYDKFKLDLKKSGCKQGMIVTMGRFSVDVTNENDKDLITLWNREDIREHLDL